MVEIVFTFEVSKEEQEDFLNFIKTDIKPYWESHGCLGYNVWQAVAEDSFIKRMEFSDMATVDKLMPAAMQDPEGKALIEKFISFAKNESHKTYIKLT